MEVFALDLAVRETGAAQVEQSLAAVRAEAQKTAASAARMGTQVSAATQRAAQNATKGSLAFAGMARNMVATGNAASLMSGGVVAAGSHVATMFGPAGILVAAIGFFTTTMISSMRKVREEVKKTMGEIDADTRRMAQVLGDISRIRSAEDVQQSLDLLRGGTGRGVSGPRAAVEDIRALGIAGIERDIIGMQRTLQRARDNAINLTLTPEARDAAREQIKELTATVQRYTTVLNELRTAETALLDRQRQLNAEAAIRLQRSNDEVRAAAERTAAIERERTAILNRERIRAIGPAGLPRGFENLPSKKPLFTPEQIAEALRITELQNDLATGIAGAITGGIVAGISQAIASGDIGAGFGALAGALLAGLGSAMVEFGTASLLASTFMQSIKDALASFNPVAGIAASLGLIAAGSILGGVAQRAFGGMGAARGGAGAGGRYAPFTPSAPPPEATRIVFGPTSAGLAAGLTPVVAPNITVIGPNDPTAQRAIEEILRNANRRGTLR